MNARVGPVLALTLPGVRTVYSVDGVDAVTVALDAARGRDPRPRHAAHGGLDAAQRLQQRMGKDRPSSSPPRATYKRCAKAMACSTTRCESRSRSIDSPATWRARWCIPTAPTDRGPRRPLEGEMLGATVSRRAADAPLPHAGARCIPDSRARAAPCTASSRTRPSRTTRCRRRRSSRGGPTWRQRSMSAPWGAPPEDGRAAQAAPLAARQSTASARSAKPRRSRRIPGGRFLHLGLDPERHRCHRRGRRRRRFRHRREGRCRHDLGLRCQRCCERRQRIAGRRQRRSIERPHSPAQGRHARQRERGRHAEVGAAART